MTRLARVCSGKTVATTHDDLVWVAESRSLHTCALYVHDEKGVIILSGRRQLLRLAVILCVVDRRRRWRRRRRRSPARWWRNLDRRANRRKALQVIRKRGTRVRRRRWRGYRERNGRRGKVLSYKKKTKKESNHRKDNRDEPYQRPACANGRPLETHGGGGRNATEPGACYAGNHPRGRSHVESVFRDFLLFSEAIPLRSYFHHGRRW